jgi:hypothetical protein
MPNDFASPTAFPRDAGDCSPTFERREERRGSGKEKDQRFSRLPSSRPNWEGGWI